MLIPATANDLNFFYDLYMHPLINRYLLYELMDEASFEPIYSDLLVQKCLYKFVEGEKPIGMCKLVEMKYRDHHKIYVGGVAIDPKESGKNYGYKMMLDILNFAKQKDKKRVELTVAVENLKAIALYKKAGFMEEGVLRKFGHLVSENKYVDELMMSYILE